jgi:hypothetical protein
MPERRGLNNVGAEHVRLIDSSARRDRTSPLFLRSNPGHTPRSTIRPELSTPRPRPRISVHTPPRVHADLRIWRPG